MLKFVVYFCFLQCIAISNEKHICGNKSIVSHSFPFVFYHIFFTVFSKNKPRRLTSHENVKMDQFELFTSLTDQYEKAVLSFLIRSENLFAPFFRPWFHSISSYSCLNSA